MDWNVAVWKWPFEHGHILGVKKNEKSINKILQVILKILLIEI